MASGDAHDPVPWVDGAAPELEEELGRSLIFSPREDESDEIRWICPRCHHEQFLDVLRDQIWAGLGSATRSGEVFLRCACPFSHDGRPEGAVGCGYKIVATVTEEEE